MKATLIHPVTTYDDFDSSWIPHGLASISAYAKSRGHTIDLIDFRHLPYDNDRALAIKNSQSTIFGISILSVNHDNAVQTIFLIRKYHKNAKIIIGGIHPTVKPVDYNDLPVDHIIKGEGEITFTEIIEGKNTKPIVQGTTPNLNEIPFVDRTLFSTDERPIVDCISPPFVTLTVGRGCPYTCSFCFPAEKKLFGDKVAMRSVDNVLTELFALKQTCRFNSYLIHDDCLIAFKRWCNEFIEKLRLKPLDAQFFCQARADLIVSNEQLIKNLKSAGLKGCLVGFESGSDRVLKFLKKGVTVKQNILAAQILKQNGIKIWANVMTGIPTETKEEAVATYYMVEKIKPDYLSLAYFTPHPGSILFDYCEKKNISLISHSSGYRRYPDEPKILGVDYSYLKKLWAKKCRPE